MYKYYKRGDYLQDNLAYIRQIEASYIVLGMLNNGEYVDKRKEELQYLGSMTDSIQMDYFEQIAKKKSFFRKNNHLYCKSFISVTFDNPIYEGETGNRKQVMNNKETRLYLYENGFIVEGTKFVRYQRSSGSARVGSCLFIEERYYDQMTKFSNMGLKFEEGEECDIASLFAYQSLTLSTMIDKIEINPDEILLIDDQSTSFKTMASLTELDEKGRVTVAEKEITQTQDLWDGQSLMDESLFGEKYKDKGMLLLRNHFFKSACFNTKIQKFFHDNDVYEVEDMFGRRMDARNIKLITTPNSLKALKFSYKMKRKKNQDLQMYEYWLDKMTDFGIVKYEKPSKFGSYNRTSYQMINSLPFTREDIHELMKEEINYIDLINNNVAVFKHRLSISEPNTNYSFIMNMITINDDIQYTKLYKDARRNVVNSHKKKLLKGKIRINNSDYFTMVSMPYEMLEYAAFNRWSPVFTGKKVYSSYFKHGERLAGFRNPHVMSSNVELVKNEYHYKFDEYFNFSTNIVVVSPWDNDITNRLQGADLTV